MISDRDEIEDFFHQVSNISQIKLRSLDRFGRKSKCQRLGDNGHAFGKKYRSDFLKRQSLCCRASSVLGMTLAVDCLGLLPIKKEF